MDRSTHDRQSLCGSRNILMPRSARLFAVVITCSSVSALHGPAMIIGRLESIPGSKIDCKSHNMSGWRIGMLASNPQFIEWILKVKSNIDSGMFRPLQMAATKALSCGQEWYDQLNEVYRNRRDIAEKIMKALGCSYDPSQAGLFVWGKIPDSATDAESLADEILYNAHVFITPGFIFGSRGNRYIRISLCAPEKKMQEALHRIEKIKSNK